MRPIPVKGIVWMTKEMKKLPSWRHLVTRCFARGHIDEACVIRNLGPKVGKEVIAEVSRKVRVLQ